MNKKFFEHPLLNGGKKTEIFFPTSEKEVDDQFSEIFQSANYGFYLPENGIYLDLGANIGMSVLYFANFAKKIYALEPNPEIYEALVENTKHLGDKVETFNVGWANDTGKSFFYGDENGSLPQTLWDRGKRGMSSSIVADFYRPDEFLRDYKIGHIDLAKIDIEDAEYILFPDDNFGKATKNIEAIIGEAHYSANGGFPEIIPNLLGEWGYKTEFPALKYHNYIKFFKYTDLITNQTKTYEYPCSTIFLAKKK